MLDVQVITKSIRIPSTAALYQVSANQKKGKNNNNKSI